MAARKDSENLTHSQINVGDAFFDLCCSPCAKKNLNKEAVKYCTTCKDYFCASCVEYHKMFKAMSNHVLIEPTTSRSTSSKTGTKFDAIPTQLCKKHRTEVVNMYCRSEDTVGCSVCFLYQHRSCDDIHYIPEYVQTNFPTEQVKQINTDLTQAIKAMTKLKTQHDRLNDNLDKCKAKCKQEIQNYRAEINGIIDKIEAATLEELDARHKDTKKKTGDTHHNIHEIHDEMKMFKSEIESDQSNDSQKFVIAKLSQCLMRKGQELQSELTHDQTTQLTFTRNTDIMTFLLSVLTLGLLSHQPIRDSSLPTVTSRSKQPNATSNLSASGDCRNSKKIPAQQEDTMTAIKPQKQSLYKILSKSTNNIKQKDDKTRCYTWSSCILDNSDILLADYNNKTLKLVDSRTYYTVRSSLVLDANPRSVCRVSSTEAAVCINNNTIQFVSTCDKLVLIRSLSMEHGCRCIAVIADKMYVCDGKSVYIYTLNSQLIQTISKDKSGNAIFSDIWDITVSEDEKMIHVTDWDNGVITLNTDGDVEWRYSGTALSKALGVCTDGNGNVIVCGFESKNVVQLAPNGQFMGEIATRSDGVSGPTAVCYDRNNHKLIVGGHMNNITVFTVH